MKPIRRPKALGGSGEQFSRVKVLAYRCKRGHVFLFGQGDGEKKSAAGAE